MVLGPAYSLRQSDNQFRDRFPSLTDFPGMSGNEFSTVTVKKRNPKSGEETTLIKFFNGNPKNLIDIASEDEEIVAVKDWHLGGRTLQNALVLQHYGCPTGSIDITRDAETALWFALHACQYTNGEMRFEQFTWSGADPSRWPTVFVFPLVPRHPFLDTESILSGSDVLRPLRQHCGILGGAGNLARNYGARYISFKFRLAPGFMWSSKLSADELFPGPEEDLALARLLRAQEANDKSNNTNVFPVTLLQQS